ncbi:hypothetical protein CORC01_10755 [Colletotrichum orchidophilum]|uniref:Uncharacterized protein n=1 Tax=Colletotrichum orchidophilum TaxID=1209926 RepID=A0A1G4AXS8_9PEZI|nr:uncharacterized protein CORC01_10755 [Colletotrichum orchidophilum]OHE93968.1 hypothetical protein CORC01_10755 [Colletotrichum orchidophilum]
MNRRAAEAVTFRHSFRTDATPHSETEQATKTPTPTPTVHAMPFTIRPAGHRRHRPAPISPRAPPRANIVARFPSERTTRDVRRANTAQRHVYTLLPTHAGRDAIDCHYGYYGYYGYDGYGYGYYYHYSYY